jgi:hypothetical protein
MKRGITVRILAMTNIDRAIIVIDGLREHCTIAEDPRTCGALGG